MNRGRKRRRISEIGVFEILQDSPHVDGHYSDIHHLIHRSRAEHLHSQQLMSFPVGDQLSSEKRRVRIIMGLVVRNRQDCHHVVAGLLGLGFRQAGAAAVQARQLNHAGAQNAGIGFLLAGQHLGQGTPLQVSGGAHRRPLAAAGDPVGHQSAVAGGIYAGEIGFQLGIHHNGALLHLDAAGSQKRRIGTDARRKHHQFCGQRGGGGFHCRYPGIPHQLFRFRSGQNTDPLLPQMPLGVIRHFRIQHIGHNLRSEIHHGHIHALGQQVFRYLQANKASADHYGLFYPFRFHVIPNPNSVVRRPHFEHALQAHSLDGRHRGGRSGGDH